MFLAQSEETGGEGGNGKKEQREEGGMKAIEIEREGRKNDKRRRGRERRS